MGMVVMDIIGTMPVFVRDGRVVVAMGMIFHDEKGQGSCDQNDGNDLQRRDGFSKKQGGQENSEEGR